MIELQMSWELALALGAELPRNVPENRMMLRSGRYLRVRVRNMAGLLVFWECQPGIAWAGEDPNSGPAAS